MIKLILFGGIGENFPTLSVQALFNGARTAGSMALLLQDEIIAEPFRQVAGRWAEYCSKIDFILLSQLDWTKKAADAVKSASIILLGPGKTMKYRDAILASSVGNLIAQRVAVGIPYAGISAGAMLAGECLARDTEDGIAVFPALGLLKGMCIEPHYESPDRDASLQYQMKNTGLNRGLGIGNAVCALISGDDCIVAGNGLCTLKQRCDAGGETEAHYQAGDQFSFL